MKETWKELKKSLTQLEHGVFGNCVKNARIRNFLVSLNHLERVFNVISVFRSGRISSVYIVGCWLVGCGWVTLFQNLFILSVVVL